MAWVLNDTSNSGKYNLYIGGNGIIYANSNSSYLFYKFEALTTVTGLENFDTSNVTNMMCMFSYAGYSVASWTIGDLSNWDTSNVTDMGYMFEGCSSLTSLDLSSFNMGNVMSISLMFAECDDLMELHTPYNFVSILDVEDITISIEEFITKPFYDVKFDMVIEPDMFSNLEGANYLIENLTESHTWLEFNAMS